MPSRTRRVPPPAAAPLRQPPTRLRPMDPGAVVAELRELHVAADDATVEQMPADEHPREALLYAERRAHTLTDPAARRRATLLRVRLWEFLRREADPHQSRAVRDARDAGVHWEDLAEPLGVKKGSASAAESKARRLRATELSAMPGALPVRRTPEAVARTEAERAEAERVERLREIREQRRGEATVRLGRELLAVRAELAADEEADYWLDQVAAVVTDCRTPRQIASLGTYVSAALRHLQPVDRHTEPAQAVLHKVQKWEQDTTHA
ncbi:hypothetical protein ACQEU8_35940 [Streptomyces sp. CA-250714]|uniref:hypothetical protein n=1 Tax=Streptomyces sp. CA-250714 TaxID=3240060 RepID=UPI003D93C64C